MTTRQNILTAINAAVLGLDLVGAVVEAGRFNEGEEVATISEAIASGKYAVEMLIGDDEVRDGDARVSGTVNKSFTVFFTVHCPPSVVDADGAIAATEAIYAALVALYGGQDPDAGTWGGLAIRTMDQGGGGVGVDPSLGTCITLVEAEVHYRHPWGQL
ncbi:MAG: hypothetical protein AAF108_02910 [Planctomycetota bacterium]